MSDLIGRRIGPYEIRDEIGRGGMASVYRAYQTSLNRYVAIKVLATWLAQDTQFVQRFRQEALAAGGLRHPNILGVIDAGTFEGQYFIVMDYVSGGTLSEIMRRGPMPAEQAADLAAQIADALDYASRRGIVHRDLKPSNILIDEDGRPLLADFGIAQALGSGLHLTQTGSSIGTPEYMSPEQSQGMRVDGRSDIYSLGIVLYQMVTGRVPFQTTTPVATLYQIIHQPPPPPRTINPSIPPYLESIILRAIAKQPEARFATGREMAQALRERRLVAAPDTETQYVGAAALLAAKPLTSAPSAKTRGGTSIGLRILVALLILVILALAGGAAYMALDLGGRSADAQPTAEVALSIPTVLVSAPIAVPDAPTAAAIAAQDKPTPTNTPSSTPTTALPTQTPAILVVTATFEPTSTPAPSATPSATPASLPSATPRPQAVVQPTQAPVPASAPAKPGVVLDFENLGSWRRGDEPYGSLTQAADRKHDGAYSANLSYQIPQVDKHYVVFTRQPAAAIPGQPTALNMWVYGDGSGHFLNAWIQDSQSEVRQFTFGQLRHSDAWQAMTLSLDPAAPWPQAHISGPDNGKLDYPISLYALVLDAAPRAGTTSYNGTVYLDDLTVGAAAGPGASPAVSSAPVPASAPAPAATAAGNAPAAGVTGRIVYTGGSGGTTDVFVVNAADKSTRRLFANARQPDMRLDGRVVLNGIGGGKNNIFSINQDGSAETMNGRHPEDSYPHWSPTGGSTVFHSTIGDGKERIYVQSDMSRSEEPTPLTIGGVSAFGRLPIWLSSGRVAFSGCDYWAGGSNCGIWTMNNNGSGQPARLTDRMDDHVTDSMGSTVLYASQAAGNWEVFAIPENGGTPRNLTSSPGQDTGATFSPDGRSIAFMSNRDGGWGIWIMNADGSNPRKLIAVAEGFGAGWAEESLAWGS